MVVPSVPALAVSATFALSAPAVSVTVVSVAVLAVSVAVVSLSLVALAAGGGAAVREDEELAGPPIPQRVGEWATVVLCGYGVLLRSVCYVIFNFPTILRSGGSGLLG